MDSTLIGLLMTFGAAALAAAAFLGASMLLGPKKPNPAKDMPFECGNPPGPVPAGFVPLKFYRIAILFVLFDIEVVFFYPWVLVFDEQRLFYLLEMAVFVTILMVGFAYLWKVGALEWD